MGIVFKDAVVHLGENGTLIDNSDGGRPTESTLTDLSEYVRSVTLNIEAELIDDTTMGDDFRSMIGGLQSFSVDVTMTQSYDARAGSKGVESTKATKAIVAGGIDKLLFDNLGKVVPIIVRPNSAALAAGNPEYRANVILSTHSALSGNVGELHETTVRFASSSGALHREIS